MLTRKQRELLIFIHEEIQKNDVPPSFEEMKDALGLKSKSGIHRLISALVERGYLQRLPHRARAINILKLPETYESHQASSPAAANSEALSVPLYGKIAAGTPIEAIRHEGQAIDMPADMLGKGDHYALEVEGESMIKAGIFDADTVVIRKTETAENGSIVVALVDHEEVTLKRFRRSGNKIILEPENDTHEPRVLDPERVQVQGKLVSLLRRY